jgi:hypothetical protein
MDLRLATLKAHLQTGPGAHPASYTVVTGSFPVVKRPGRCADYSPLLVPRSRKSRAVPLLPLSAFESVTGNHLHIWETNLGSVKVVANIDD